MIRLFQYHHLVRTTQNHHHSLHHLRGPDARPSLTAQSPQRCSPAEHLLRSCDLQSTNLSGPWSHLMSGKNLSLMDPEACSFLLWHPTDILRSWREPKREQQDNLSLWPNFLWGDRDTMDMAVPMPCPQYLSAHGPLCPSLPSLAVHAKLHWTSTMVYFCFFQLLSCSHNPKCPQGYSKWMAPPKQTPSPIPFRCSEVSLLHKVHGQAAKALPGAC